MAKERRFVVSNKEGKIDCVKIITDSKTGVQYLFAAEGYAGGLTVLLNKDGRPLLNEDYCS